MNCWEFRKCGRERGGDRADELGVCPAYPDNGRSCARVSGTMCEGVVQGDFVLKFPTCITCEYYKSAHYDKSYLKDEAGYASGNDLVPNGSYKNK